MPLNNFSSNSAGPFGLLRKTAAFIVTVSLIVLGLMFSALLFAVIVVLVAIAWVYLWWKTRDLRKQMRDHPVVFERTEIREGEFDSAVIEGEVIHKVVTKIESGRGS